MEAPKREDVGGWVVAADAPPNRLVAPVVAGWVAAAVVAVFPNSDALGVVVDAPSVLPNRLEPAAGCVVAVGVVAAPPKSDAFGVVVEAVDCPNTELPSPNRPPLDGGAAGVVEVAAVDVAGFAPKSEVAGVVEPNKLPPVMVLACGVVVP